MTAFIAMLVDAYRHLNSKKLFWITLGLSGVIVVFYNQNGKIIRHKMLLTPSG